MNFSIPEKIKEQMEALSQPVDWSGIVVEAIATKLQEIDRRKYATYIGDVVRRLQAGGESVSFNKGQEAGREWACNRATWLELQRAAREDQNPEVMVGEPDHLGWAGAFYRAIHDVEEVDQDEVEQFWAQCSMRHPNDERLRGFLMGAGEVFEAVSDRLEPTLK